MERNENILKNEEILEKWWEKWIYPNEVFIYVFTYEVDDLTVELVERKFIYLLLIFENVWVLYQVISPYAPPRVADGNLIKVELN